MATDDFNRANAGNLGANWTNVDNGMQVDTNRAVGTVDVAVNTAYYSGASFSNDQYSEATLYNGGVSRSLLIVRLTGGGDMYYADFSVAAGRIQLWKRVSSSFTQLGSDLAAPTSGLVYKLEVIGTAIKLYEGGVLVTGSSQTDSDVVSGSPGIGAIATTEGWDDWTGADIGGDVPIGRQLCS